MAAKTVSANTAKKKPRGKPFTGNADPRNNRNGQRSAAVVRTQAEMRELYVKVLHERGDELKPNPDATNMETIVRRHVLAAVNGDAAQREQVIDRIWGRATAPVELSGKDGTPLEIVFREVLTINAND